MADQSTTNANAYLAFTTDTNLIPVGIKSSFLPVPTASTIGAVRAGTNITIDANGVISATGGGTGTVTNVSFNAPYNNAFAISNPSTTPAIAFANVGANPNQVFLRGDANWVQPLTSFAVTGGTARTGAVSLTAGSNVTIVDNADGTFTINSSGGGGGGGAFSSVVAVWASTGTATKNAQSAPGVPILSDINISLTATSVPSAITGISVRLNGTATANTYTLAGNFPNYTLTVPQNDIAGVAFATATVTVTLSNSVFNVSANNLMNTQPIAFNTVLSASYSVANLPYYTTTTTINYSYSNSIAITDFNGHITLTGGTQQNATSPSGSFANQPVNGATIGGTATGMGQFGAGSSTVTLSGSVPAVTVYTPAFYTQTASNVVPTFTTATSQTTGQAAGSMITYPIASASTQYNWIATTLPVSRVQVMTPLGTAPFVPDVTTTQTIAGVSFNIFGATGLSTTVAAVLIITAS